MKKLLILLVSMASIASAVPVMTIDGGAAPEEITLDVSDEMIIGATIDPDLVGGTLDFVLSNEQGALDTSAVVTNPNYSLLGIVDQPWDFAWVVNMGATPQYVSFGGGNFQTANGDTRWIIDGLLFHCESPTDVTLTMVAGTGGIDYSTGTDIAEGTILGTVLIHQIPEPMTIALLGLGGLLLRRRK